MKSIIKKITEENRRNEMAEAAAVQAEINNPRTSNDRRSFLKRAALGGIALGGLMHLSIEDTISQTTSKVQRLSAPADLKITDMRVALTGGTISPGIFEIIEVLGKETTIKRLQKGMDFAKRS